MTLVGIQSIDTIEVLIKAKVVSQEGAIIQSVIIFFVFKGKI